MRSHAVLALAALVALAAPATADAQSVPTGPPSELRIYNPSWTPPSMPGSAANDRSGGPEDQMIMTEPSDMAPAGSVRVVKIDPLAANAALNTEAEHERRASAQAKVGADPRIVQALESAGIGINSITDVAVENGLATIYYSN